MDGAKEVDMPAPTELRHHICPYLCCHLEHVVGKCPLDRCGNVPCCGEDCWWYVERTEPQPGVDHFSPKWIELHRDGSVPVP
jgi:hypothetical protein